MDKYSISTVATKRKNVRRPDAADNARPRKAHVVPGGRGRKALLTGELDRRTRVGKAHMARCKALSADIGGDPSAAQARLIDTAARLSLLADLSWGEISERGMFDDKGSPRPAFDTFIRTIGQERATLQLLGLERQAKPVPELHEYLAQRYGKDGNADADDH